MQMTERQIYRSYERAGRAKRQIRVLAELNACPEEDIRKIIEAMDMEMEKQQKETPAVKPRAKRGRKKKTEQQKTEKPEARIPEAVLGAMRKRIAALETQGEDLKRHIADLQDELSEILEEWGTLTEWLAANSPEDREEQNNVLQQM